MLTHKLHKPKGIIRNFFFTFNKFNIIFIPEIVVYLENKKEIPVIIHKCFGKGDRDKD